MASADTVQEIKERLSVADVVGQYVKLTRAGKSLTGLCPFHKEKTPSFHVSVERGTYHCFGCGEGGDIFSFVQKVEGTDFKSTLKQLAERAGVALPEYREGNSAEADRKERLRKAMERAQWWYAQKLQDSLGASYASERGLQSPTRDAWGLGYAPLEWRALLEALTHEGFTTQELLAAGLIKEADGRPGTYYDRFRHRLMFPIRDHSGRVVAFTGRALKSDEKAKYLNSPETALYYKSEVLYGLDKAKDEIRRRGFALLMEGQMDVLHAHQAGFTNAIALSGTALTERHLALLKRYSENLMLVLDADAAGLSATVKSALLALGAGMRVKAVRLPKGKDPADLLSEDAKDFAARVTAAQHVVEFFLSVLSEQEKDAHRLVRLAEQVVLPLLRALKSPMERDHFIQLTARALSISTEAVREAMGRIAPETAQGRAGGEARLPQKKADRAELLRGIMTAYAGSPLAERVKNEYSRITGVAEPLHEDVPESARFAAEQMLGEQPSDSAADELLRAFEYAVIREAYHEAVTALRRAETSQDAAEVALVQARCAELSRKLAQFS
jgi:DNA primase